MRRLLTLLISSTLLGSFTLFAGQTPAEYEQKFADEEREYAECVIALERERANAVVPVPKDEKEAKLYSIITDQINAAGCPQYKPDLKPIDTNVRLAGPTYSQLPKDIQVINCAWNDMNEFMACEQEREKFLAPLFAENKNLNSCADSKLTVLKVTDQTAWHNYFLQHGHDCTMKEFRAQAVALNSDSTSQANFEKNLANKKLKLDLTGLNIAYMPHMTYETNYLRFNFPYNLFFPGKGELLTPEGFRRYFKEMGANVKIIHRVSSATLTEQVAQSLRELKKLDKATAKKGGFVIITRSMGSLVLTALMLDHAAELPNLKQIIHVGGTTYGSVIAEHKSRFDYFLQNTVKGNIKNIGLINLIDFLDDWDLRLNDHIDNFMKEALKTSNLETLSFKNEAIQKRKEERMAAPVVNVLFLPPTDAKRALSDDPVRQNMAAYGPTEGSGRLGDIIAQGTTTTNLVLDDKGHLAFRDLSKPEAVHLFKAILATVSR
jgi:hypothetical protein